MADHTLKTKVFVTAMSLAANISIEYMYTPAAVKRTIKQNVINT